ncbi:Putative lysine-specific demethylase JMJ16 [Striga hermonthica]|uniref:Lysine-specific demethylase JMJ16 n=1 Tax=Striga hermonthica TaxID=68872 RepID=A0A9N7NDP7_STRHE|nr:Putative lysine-specific demethylase JMJ16 [Striga hermonthica]
MRTKRSSSHAKKKAEEDLAVPPGFVSLTSFTLKRKFMGRKADDLMAVDKKSRAGSVDTPLRNIEIEKFKASFRQRPWICYDQFKNFQETDRNDVSSPPQKDSVSVRLPEGTIWGCANCHDCVKVTARWQRNESSLPSLSDAPIFYPTREEFKDTLKYIAKIRPTAENYGVCRIVPPPSSLLEETKTWCGSKFTTHFQKIDGLQNLYANKKLSEFEQGPEFTLESFKKCANDFKAQYFRKYGKGPLVSAIIEGEYWRIIEKPNVEVKVLCGEFSSSTNTTKEVAKYDEYEKSEWNLNNIPKLPGSLLPFGCYKTSSAVLVPQLFIGMCFASQCWRTEDHHLYSISYLHSGEPKVCYGIPFEYTFKFVEVLKKLHPELAKHPDFPHKLVPQLPLSVLVSEGIPVYHCVQNPMEFVVTFPGAFHTEFSCGFNLAETVRFAPFDWLPHGLKIVELYAGKCFKTSISQDKLLIGAAKEAVNAQWESFALKNKTVQNQMWISASGKNGILTNAVKERVRDERVRWKYLCNMAQSSAFDGLDATSKVDCTICSYDLYLSAVKCSCCPNKYACLRHSKQLCSCPWTSKRFFFRYEIAELDLLVEALEGNLKAIHSWVKQKAQPDSGIKISENARPNFEKQNEVILKSQAQNAFVLLSDDEDAPS